MCAKSSANGAGTLWHGDAALLKSRFLSGRHILQATWQKPCCSDSSMGSAILCWRMCAPIFRALCSVGHCATPGLVDTRWFSEQGEVLRSAYNPSILWRTIANPAGSPFLTTWPNVAHRGTSPASPCLSRASCHRLLLHCTVVCRASGFNLYKPSVPIVKCLPKRL